jgi:D-tyrosyl-tRNA(Tyr) deacylase
MRAVIQRVSRASVTINDKIKSAIGAGLLILTGIEEADDDDDIEWLCGKIVNLRIFDDSTRSDEPFSASMYR